MNMSEGPWQEGAPYGALKKEVLNAAGRVVATVFMKHYHKPTGIPAVWPEGEANLRAIVALPKLVAALKMLIERFEIYKHAKVDGENFTLWDKMSDNIQQARAALADCGAEMED